MTRAQYRDVAERTAWTFVQAAAATLIVTGFDLAALQVAGIAGAIAACKGLVAVQVTPPAADLAPGEPAPKRRRRRPVRPKADGGAVDVVTLLLVVFLVLVILLVLGIL